MANKNLRMEKAIIDSWQEDFPFCFPKWPMPKVPLAIGIGEQLKASWLPKHRKTYASLSDKELDAVMTGALKLSYRGIRYSLALCHGNRYNLNGTLAQDFSHNQVQKAEKHMKSHMDARRSPLVYLVACRYLLKNDASAAEEYYREVYKRRAHNGKRNEGGTENEPNA